MFFLPAILHSEWVEYVYEYSQVQSKDECDGSIPFAICCAVPVKPPVETQVHSGKEETKPAGAHCRPGAGLRMRKLNYNTDCFQLPRAHVHIQVLGTPASVNFVYRGMKGTPGCKVYKFSLSQKPNSFLVGRTLACGLSLKRVVF